MSKINTTIAEDQKSSLCPKSKFGQVPPKAIGSLEPHFGDKPAGKDGWTGKSRACLGLKPVTNIIWAPVYFDSPEDDADFGELANSNGYEASKFAALLVRDWFEANRSQIETETASSSRKQMTIDDLKKEIEARNRANDRARIAMEALLARSTEEKK